MKRISNLLITGCLKINKTRNENKMKENTKKCILGFNEEKILEKRKSKKELEEITDLIPTEKTKDDKLICTYKPRLKKSDKEDLGYYYKKDTLYNLNYAEVPACIFCKFYE